MGLVLTMDEVGDALKEKTRDRGGKEKTIAKLIADSSEGGEVYVDLKDILGSDDFKADSVKNGYQTKVRQLTEAAEKEGKEFPELKVIKMGEGDEETVVLVNATEHARRKAATAAEAA